MGQTNTKVDGKSIQYLGEGVSHYFGKIKLYKALGRDKDIVAVQANNHKIDVMQHGTFKHPNLVETITYDSDYKEVWYTQYGMTFYFEYLPISLYDICQKRGQAQQRFGQSEVQRLMIDILSVLKYFESTRTVAHWGLTTNNVFYDKQDKKMKVYNHELVFGKMASYFQILIGQKAYGNPEIQHVISKGVINPEIDFDTKKMVPIRKKPLLATQYGEEYMTRYKNKSDVYELGLTLLEVTTYLSSYSIYNAKSNMINQDEIQRRLGMVEKYYNRELAIFIASMLNQDPEIRPSATTLLGYINRQNQQKQIIQPQQRPRQTSVQSSSRIVGRNPLSVSQVINSRVRTRSLSQVQVPTSNSRLVIPQNGSRIQTQVPSRSISPQVQRINHRFIGQQPQNTTPSTSSNKVQNLNSKLANIISKSQSVTGSLAKPTKN